MAFGFTSIIVALSVVGELKDIRLVSIAIEQAGDNLSKQWAIGMAGISFVRRWLFLPGLIIVALRLVYINGGDALSICFK
eukprot:SAG31_NODE_1626_length_7710_cov_28.409933_2_plen_80_part_00